MEISFANEPLIVLLNIMFLVLGFFAIRTLKQVDSNQNKMSAKLDSVHDTLLILKTEHDNCAVCNVHVKV